MTAQPPHSCQVLASPWPCVHATDIASGRHYGKHWHATFGLGVIDDGAHRSASGHGAVEAYAGDIAFKTGARRLTTLAPCISATTPTSGPDSPRWRPA